MTHSLDMQQLASLLFLTAATFGLSFRSWLQVLAVYRVQEAQRRAREEHQEMQRRDVEAQLAEVRQTILQKHGLMPQPAAGGNADADA